VSSRLGSGKFLKRRDYGWVCSDLVVEGLDSNPGWKK
jgi:hypothetical protein